MMEYLTNTSMTDNNITINTMAVNNVTLHSGPQWTEMERIIMTAILGVIMTIAVLGNGVILVIFCAKKAMRTKTNLFITNLALGDFLNAILVMPVSLTTMYKGLWVFNSTVCTLNGISTLMFFTVSIHTLMFISIERYVVITKPVRRSMTRTKIYVTIVIAWLWSLLYGILGGFVISHFVYKEGTTQCGPTYPHSLKEYIFAGVVLFSYILPLAVMTYTYIYIFREIKNHLARLATVTTMDHDDIISCRRRSTVTIFMALMLFVVLWLPLAVYIPYVTTVAYYGGHIPHIINPIVYWCGFLNSACNPILFGFRIPVLRLTIKKCLYRLCGIKYNGSNQPPNSSGGLTTRTPRSTPMSTPTLRRHRDIDLGSSNTAKSQEQCTSNATTQSLL